MKQYLFIAAVAVSVLLAVALILTKRSDNAQLDTASGTIVDFSNRLDTAQAQIASRDGNLAAMSNSLAECQSVSLAFSNQLTQAQSTNALQSEQISSLNQQIATTASENREHITDLTNQMAALTGRITVAETNLAQANQSLVQANQNYARLQNRFLRDVAERVIVERRFNNLAEVQAQEQKLWKTAVPWITPESIYAGLNVEVESNGVAHVLAPD